ncbi:hypothetical protein D8I30_00325 [Brevundimonas naejangsanensis]|uniref:Uncharacterized protein n=1 Tax=Brevundimonas naejangsanensis TaxID=588932 RepID=A0A494RIK5_9CAUL|nr:hypothetical protein [Brevundimonas naejangsanensis]AYG93794.1 hypothetical protein D8I30_00325 [Brevundimonas naejangsanensis]
MNRNLKLWLRAANPFTPPRGMAEAQRAARAGAVALAIGAIQSLAILPLMPERMTQSTDLMMQQGAGLAAEDQAFIEAAMAAMTPMMMIGVVVFSILYLVLAVVQWRRMTWVIPAVMLGLLAYSLLSALSGVAMLGEKAGQFYTPLAVVQWVVMLATGLVHVAALRGGRMLEQLKRSV